MEEEFVFKKKFIGFETEIFIRLARGAMENPLNPENLLNPTLSTMSRSFYVSSVLHDKKFHSKYEALCERKLTFSELATSEIQVPIWLIDVYWSGIFFFQQNSKIFKINGKTLQEVELKGFRLVIFFFWWFFISTLGGGEKNREKIVKNVFFFTM